LRDFLAHQQLLVLDPGLDLHDVGSRLVHPALGAKAGEQVPLQHQPGLPGRVQGEIRVRPTVAAFGVQAGPNSRPGPNPGRPGRPLVEPSDWRFRDAAPMPSWSNGPDRPAWAALAAFPPNHKAPSPAVRPTAFPDRPWRCAGYSAPGSAPAGSWKPPPRPWSRRSWA
jgi:hypothetical protein